MSTLSAFSGSTTLLLAGVWYCFAKLFQIPEKESCLGEEGVLGKSSVVCFKLFNEIYTTPLMALLEAAPVG